MQYIEDIIESDIINNLKYVYNKEDDKQIMLIFFLRSSIYYQKLKITTKEYIDFLFKELNLPNEEIIKYKNIEVSRIGYKANNFQNIMESFIFECLDSYYNDLYKGKILGNELIKNNFNNYFKHAQNSLKSLRKKSSNYNYILQYIMLESLYSEFSLKLNAPIKIENIEYPLNHNDFKLTFDEECNIYYNEYLKNNNKLLEKELEDYIVRNGIDDIKIITRQFKTKNGIIDLMGRKNDKKLFIELKVVNKPKDLLWQIQTYRKDLEDIYGYPIDSIIVAPKLHQSVSELIPEWCMIYEYKKIGKNFKFKKVK